jgi:beta-phosphoglucomutase-like phosphatase (HAD superfamily)
MDKRQIAIFDLDGTLVDTNAANSAAYCTALCEVGIGSGMFDMRLRITGKDICNAAKLVNVCDIAAIKRRKAEAYGRQLWRTRLGPAADALRFVLHNRSAFSKVVLLTDSIERRAYETLRFWKLDDCFDEIVCNGGNGDKYANYFKAYDSDPAACVVWENENRQINAAIAAGVRKENIRKVA